VLRVLKADRLIMAGVATNSVVLTSVACAADMGYEVTVVADACSSGHLALHEASLENMRLVADVVDIASLAARIRAG
jgi:nicotinamidase-related amidase